MYQVSIMITFACILSVATMTLFTGLRLSSKITALVKYNSVSSSNYTGVNSNDTTIDPHASAYPGLSPEAAEMLALQQQQQLALRNAANKLVICMSILMVCMAVQTIVIVQSYYTDFKPSTTSENWVGMTFW